MGIGLVAGRDFTDRDRADRSDIVILNETVARRYFAGRNAIGGRIRIGQRSMEIVGVARDGKYSNIMESPRPFMYLPVQQWYRADTVLAVKTADNPTALAFSRGVESLRYGISGSDLRVFSAASFIVLIVAAIACYVPARRAAAIDPLEALRRV